MVVARTKSRVEVFQNIYNLLNKSPPTYTNKSGTTSTYTVLSSFPEASPIFPCIVVNPIVQNVKFLGVAERPNSSLPANIEIEFYAKVCDGKNAIDVARDKVQMIILNNWITSVTTIDTSLPGREVNITGIE